MSMFSTVIDKNPILANMEKLQHLKSCLRGPALDVVGALKVTDVNYPVALDLLDKRYNNKRLIFGAHISAIMNLPKVERSSSGKLRELSDQINLRLRALHSMSSCENIRVYSRLLSSPKGRP